jgi:hypothetical protein
LLPAQVLLSPHRSDRLLLAALLHRRCSGYLSAAKFASDVPQPD